MALFVMNRPGDRFDGIEAPAVVSRLPVVLAERLVDPQLLRSRELGFLHGHVPVTGILSAVAVLAAVIDRREAVVMSNERSASVPTLEHNGWPVNHQWSKSAAFEAAFRSVLAAQPARLPDYFSALRDRTELWVAQRFANLDRYHSTFRSCNRAFPLDRARRLDHWCGQCDKVLLHRFDPGPVYARQGAAGGIHWRVRATARRRALAEVPRPARDGYQAIRMRG